MVAAHADPTHALAHKPAVTDVAAALDRHATYSSALRWEPVAPATPGSPNGTRALAPDSSQGLRLDRDGVANPMGTRHLDDHDHATVIIAVSGPERLSDTTRLQQVLASGTVARDQERWADIFQAGTIDDGTTVTVLEHDPKETRFPIWWQRVLLRDLLIVLLGT